MKLSTIVLVLFALGPLEAIAADAVIWFDPPAGNYCAILQNPTETVTVNFAYVSGRKYVITEAALVSAGFASGDFIGEIFATTAGAVDPVNGLPVGAVGLTGWNGATVEPPKVIAISLTNFPPAPANWLNAAAVAADVTPELQAGLATSAAQTTAQADITTLVDRPSPLNAAQTESEASDALNAYDGPTFAEMVARTNLAADYFDWTTDTVLVADKTGFALSPAGVTSAQAGLATSGAQTTAQTDLTALIGRPSPLTQAQSEAEATDALNAYDGPTNAEMVARTLASADYATSAALAIADAVADTIAAKLPSNGRKMAGEGAIATDLDDISGGGGGGLSQPRVNYPAAIAFRRKISNRADGSHEVPIPIRLPPGPVGDIAIAIDMAPLYGTFHVYEVGDPVVSGGTLVGEWLGPRDTEAMVQISGTATASEERKVTFPVTMDTPTREVVPVTFTIKVNAQ